MNEGSAIGDVTTETARAAVTRMKSWTSQSIDLFNGFYSNAMCWPYELRDGEAVSRPSSFSVSTTAMIIHACLVSTGDIQSSVLVPKTGSWRPIDSTSKLRRHLTSSTTKLYEECQSAEGPVTTSTTWGNDDPLTLTWLYEIIKSRIVADEGLESRLTDRIQDRIHEALAHPESVVLSNVASGPRAVPHVFPLLRIVQLRDALKSNGDLKPNIFHQSTEVVADWFRNQLYTQLSLSDIPNSEFDPASLVFALEGLLSVGGHRVNDLLIRRTLAVMQENARTGSYWRPVKPIRIDSRGNILLPQSVEVANSLLRICHIGAGGGESWFPLIVEELFSYARWLEGRVIKGHTKSGKKFAGWQSDHTHADGLIHFWATSQTMLFCEHYGAVMQDHLARLLRENAGLEFGLLEGNESWKTISEKEPLSGLPEGSGNRTYSRLKVRFIDPLTERARNASNSLLVYGPPGTGKTALAEDLARTLNFQLITITMSDFIRSGEAGVEARAKQIFEALNEQSSVVVLFDEIDRLILSRDSPEYGKQSDMFQFMTPSMLTKLNNLKRKGTVLWIIATNYEERLDSAIKRAGRIDESILLLPPDLRQRKEIIRHNVLKLSGRISDSHVDVLARRTSLFAYQEIRGVCQTGLEIWKLSDSSDRPSIGASILLAAKIFEPAISIAAYRSRCSPDSNEFPVKEVIYLAYLVLESGGTLEAERDWLEPIVEKGLVRTDIDNIVRSQLNLFLG
jgi:hypothetical protein